jgi:hypothetical protein
MQQVVPVVAVVVMRMLRCCPWRSLSLISKAGGVVDRLQAAGHLLLACMCPTGDEWRQQDV